MHDTDINVLQVGHIMSAPLTISLFFLFFIIIFFFIISLSCGAFPH